MYNNLTDKESDFTKPPKEEKEELYPGTFNEEAVKEVQTFLNDEGIGDQYGDTLRVDGRYGAKTANAVIKYQRSNGILADGIVGKETWDSIDSKKRKKEKSDIWGEHKTVPEKWENTKFPLNKRSKEPWPLFKPEETNSKNRIKRYPTDRSSGQFEPKENISSLRFRPNPKADFAKADAFSYAIPPTDSPASREKKNHYEASDPASAAFLYSDTIPKENFESETLSNSPVEKNLKEEEFGVIKPGYNAKGEWSEDPDKDNFGEDSPKYRLLNVFDNADKIAASNNNRNARIAIDMSVDNLRNFDTESISKVYYMVDLDAASYAGHAGLIFVNEKGESILVSFYRHSKEDDLWGAKSDTRIGVLDRKATEKMLNGGTTKTSSSSGDFCTEQYDKGLGYNISPEQGKRMLEAGIKIAENNPSYNLLFVDCNRIAQAILFAGGILQHHHFSPRVTYYDNLFNSDEIIR